MELNAIVNAISEKCPGSILKQTENHGINEITVSAQCFYEVMQTLQGDGCGFDMLTDVVGIDRMPRAPRFDLLYVLLSMKDFSRLIVRLEAGEGQEVPSVSSIWHSANWGEREVFDLMGINFSNHPDLRRILTWENFDGHPLRKDFPLEGKDFDKPFDTKTVKDYC
ncbi:NADH-quinone oxidoreductase subunit C [Syntrophobacter sp. SbD1]|nr:NADH-quinone oxidoreductase subunit C [Syntrophobacter sp. SbD1]